MRSARSRHARPGLLSKVSLLSTASGNTQTALRQLAWILGEAQVLAELLGGELLELQLGAEPAGQDGDLPVVATPAVGDQVGTGQWSAAASTRVSERDVADNVSEWGARRCPCRAGRILPYRR